MRHKAALAVAVAVCFSLAAAVATPAQPSPEENPVPLVAGECFEVVSTNVGEQTRVAVEVSQQPRFFTDRTARSTDPSMDPDWHFVRHDWNVSLTLKPAASALAASREEPAAEAGEDDPLPELVVTVHESDDPSGPSRSFQLNLPEESTTDAAGSIQATAVTPSGC